MVRRKCAAVRELCCALSGSSAGREEEAGRCMNVIRYSKSPRHPCRGRKGRSGKTAGLLDCPMLGAFARRTRPERDTARRAVRNGRAGSVEAIAKRQSIQGPFFDGRQRGQGSRRRRRRELSRDVRRRACQNACPGRRRAGRTAWTRDENRWDDALRRGIRLRRGHGGGIHHGLETRREV